MDKIMTLKTNENLKFGGDFPELREILDDMGFSDEEIQSAEDVAKSNGNLSVSTVIKGEEKSKATLKKPYVLAFTHNLKVLAQLKLTSNELLVLAYILEAMEFGNLITLNQNQMAVDTGLRQPNISRCFKSLREKGVIIDKNNHTYINSNIFAKGLPHRLNKEKLENMRKAQEGNQGSYDPSF